MTNNPRIYLWVALALMIWLNYQAWNTDYGPRPEAITTTSRPGNPPPNTPAAGDLANQIPQAPKTSTATSAESSAPSAATTAVQTPAAAAETKASPVVHVHTDVLDLDISTRGGTIER
jgi:YidC/Oxa1 family membrane protein insertase